jgi:hypothetical protein
MRMNLLFDYPLRGYTIENMARIILRRKKDNNFIFCCQHFDSVDEIINKYRLECSNVTLIVNDLNRNGLKSDLIEFVLENISSRKVLGINFYDVKSRLFNTLRKYSEMCISNYEFMQNFKSLGCQVFVISVLLYENWCFDFEIYELDNISLRIYDSSAKKTLFFSPNNTHRELFFT